LNVSLHFEFNAQPLLQSFPEYLDKKVAGVALFIDVIGGFIGRENRAQRFGSGGERQAEEQKQAQKN
jgi:hypothetical protein